MDTELRSAALKISGTETPAALAFEVAAPLVEWAEVVSSGGAPTPAGTSVFTKHNWDMGMGYLWLNGWGIYHLIGGAFMAYWVGHL